MRLGCVFANLSSSTPSDQENEPTVNPPHSCKVTTLLAAHPGIWRNAFEAYLKAMPELEVTARVNDLSETMQILKAHPSETLVLEAGLCNPDLASVLADLKNTFPGMRIIVISDTLPQYQVALAAEIGWVLVKSMLPDPLAPDIFTGHPP